MNQNVFVFYITECVRAHEAIVFNSMVFTEFVMDNYGSICFAYGVIYFKLRVLSFEEFYDI